MLDPRTIMVAVPCHDGRVMCETAGSLIACQGLFAAVSFPAECSHVSLVRNLIAGAFLASPYEWLVCVDSDVAFSRVDMQFLLQPCDDGAFFSSEHSRDVGDAESDRPTRVVVSQSASAQQLDSKTGAAADALVVAEYPFKNDELQPVKLGMGFVRIHRSVFEVLQSLKHDGGPTIEVGRVELEVLRQLRVSSRMLDPKWSAEETAEAAIAWQVSHDKIVSRLLESVDDKAGQPRLWQTSWKGRLYHDYFPSGPILSQFVPTAEWKGEDHGFFTLCMLAGIVPRIETRTRLTHIGRKAYQYMGPDVGAGQ